MISRVAVLGAGGHGTVVADVALSAGLGVVAFIDDAPEKIGSRIWGFPVLSWQSFLAAREAGATAVALGIGDNGTRERLANRARDAGIELATLVHPRAAVARSAEVGAGVVIMANASVNPNAAIGEGCIVNTGAVVEHDCRLGPFAHLSPNAALGGGVALGARTHVGMGAVALPLVRIGMDVRVGAGAVVHRDVPDGFTVVGVPARPVPREQK